MLLIVRHEMLLLKRSRLRFWLALCVPLIGALLPSLLILSASTLVYLGATGKDALMTLLVGYAKNFAPMLNVDLPTLTRWLALRVSANYFVLAPWVLIPITGAFAISAERERRTLEPMLATAMTMRQFLFGKMLALMLPASLVSYLAAVLGWLIAASIVYFQHAVVWMPDVTWMLAILLIPPLMAWHCAGLCLWLSLRARDPQAAAQLISLLVIPLLLLLIGLTSMQWVASTISVAMTAAVLSLLVPLHWWFLRHQITRRSLLARD